MYKDFLQELESSSKSGVIKKRIINFYINNGDSTIADLSRELDMSVTTVTKLISEMSEDGFIVDFGKVETSGGRRPNIYGLNPESGYFIGVDIKQTTINIGLINFKAEMVKLDMDIPFLFENTKEKLNELCDLISKFINNIEINKNKILNIGVNISGRVNPETGYSYSVFYFDERPLSQIMSEKLGFNVSIDNDTRAMAYGEYMAGNSFGCKNMIFVNISWGVAVGMIFDGKLYYGKSGFAGEFGHVTTFDNGVLCHCGKKGCLETEASGWAILRNFMERFSQGESSILSKEIKEGKDIKLENIIDAVNKDDMSAIEIVEEVGNQLGKSIAGLINLFNPEIVVIGGTLAQTGDYITLPIKSAVKKYSLNLVNKDSIIAISKLKEKAGVIGACMLSRSRLLEFH